jgi:hypothetical protein
VGEEEEEEQGGKETEQQAMQEQSKLSWNWAAEQKGCSSIHSRAPERTKGLAEENVGAHVPKLFRKPSRKSERPKQQLAFSCY